MTPPPTTFGRDDYLWDGEPMSGLCGHCQVHVDSTDPNHRVTAIMRGGRGVECVLRGDITAAEGGPLLLKEAPPPVVRMQLRAAGSSHGWTPASVSGPSDHPATIEDADDGTVYLAGWRDGTVGVWRQGLDSDELVQLCDLEVVRRWDVTVTRPAGRVDVRFALRG